MIPVLICPVINRFDLLEKMLRSVGRAANLVVIVENSCSGYNVPEDLEDLRIAYIRPPLVSLGYGGSINAAVIQTSGAPWWAFTNNDVTFGPDDPAEIERLMNEADGPRMVTHGFCWGAFNRAVVNTVGLIDDWTLHPIYFDDNDFERRCRLGGVEWIPYQGGIVHGDEGVGSLTIRSSAQYAVANARTFPENQLRYVAKWGGLPGNEQFTTPWNTGYPLWYTKPDIDGKYRRNW